ncbi:hypothetical protein [Usitatibacter palustris]|uniref:Uncharacterized protein n=1 Tax=Usitatibacter palustris TaxID=2732487 RepID=A0A6M4HBK6_9PROT|nr:hypothetical protein [Usitatibacter palustris]QJR15864.1 hypothetical protein DSM104440_02690 [Usitatibacter palustris]
MRTALVFLMLALPLSAAGDSQIARGKAAAGAELRFTINVPRVLKLELLDHPPTLEVSAQDVALGHVTVRGLRLDILANDRAGYRLRAQLSGAAFDGVEVVGLDEPVAAGREGTVVRMPSNAGKARAAPRGVEYIFRLERDAQPGVYRWPVVLSLEAP